MPSTILQLRQGTTAQHSTFTGAQAEVTVDTTKKTLVVHDAVTPGGSPLAKESQLVATAIGNTPAGNIASTTVQAALNELDAEKCPLLTSYNKQNVNYGVVAADAGKIVEYYGAGGHTFTLADIATVLGAGFRAIIAHNGSGGTLTVACTGTNLIDGLASIGLAAGQAIHIVGDAVTGHFDIVAARGYASAAINVPFTPAMNVVATNVQAAIAELAAKQPAFLTNILYPSVDGGHRDVYRAGWLPYWFNQQWGGAQFPLPDGTTGDCATMQIEDNAVTAVGNAAGAMLNSTGFKVDAQTPPFVLVKVYKVGNPVDNLQAQVWTDNGSGSPSVAVGVLGSISGKQLSSSANGELVAIPVTFPALVAGTQYHIVLSRSSGVADAANYYVVKATNARRYPHGFINNGTTAPVWTQFTGYAFCFAIPNATTSRFLQSGGQFDGKIVFSQGNPVNQSKLLCQPMRNFFDGKNFTFIQRYTGLTANQVIADFTYGLDHERLQIAVNASGFVVVSFYHETALAGTITGTTNVTTAGIKDIAVWGKFEGTGADFLRLAVNGVQEGTPLVNQTWVMSTDWRDLGSAILGGGFPVAPVWTKDFDMSVLPSAAGATYTGTATEANAFSVAGNKLYQISTGYTSTQAGYYTFNTALNNATGWAVAWKVRTTSNSNAAVKSEAVVEVHDGTKRVRINISEYFVYVIDLASGSASYVQLDCKSQDVVFVASGQGSNFYLTANGKLLYDGTGLLTTADATNLIAFGDADNNSGYNADVIWDYVKIYAGGMLLPTASTGAILHEAAHWSGDKSALLPYLYNAGTPVSVKQLCGVEKNYVGEGVAQNVTIRGVTATPTTTSAAMVTEPDMECYIVGSVIQGIHTTNQYNSAAGNVNYQAQAVDGILNNDGYQGFNSAGVGYAHTVSSPLSSAVPVGLHKVEGKCRTNAGTLTSVSTDRKLVISARS